VLDVPPPAADEILQPPAGRIERVIDRDDNVFV
jgi:hypothetical protein